MSLDPGASLTKVIAKAEGAKKPYLVTMSPELVVVSRSAVDSYRAKFRGLGIPRPEDDCWLECNGKVFAVGSLARNFRGDAGLKDLKYERAVYKAAAAIGVVVQKAYLGDSDNLSAEVSLDLAVLLPWGEYEDRDRFKKQLVKVLSDFTFRGVHLKVKLERVMCRPEGSGLVMARIAKKGPNWFRDRTIAVLMLGYRNVTVLTFKDGQLVAGESPELGFFRLEENVIARTSGQQPLALARAIFRAYYTIMTTRTGDITNPLHMEDLPMIQDLARSRDAELKANEVRSIVEAIAASRSDYWQELTRWLDGGLPRELDEVIICGGSSVYLQSELETYFEGESSRYNLTRLETLQNKSQVSIHWASEASLKIETLFNLKSSRYVEEALSFRLIDVYGLFWCFSRLQEAAA